VYRKNKDSGNWGTEWSDDVNDDEQAATFFGEGAKFLGKESFYVSTVGGKKYWYLSADKTAKLLTDKPDDAKIKLLDNGSLILNVGGMVYQIGELGVGKILTDWRFQFQILLELDSQISRTH
jgi:hypothetical protein